MDIVVIFTAQLRQRVGQERVIVELADQETE